MKSSKYMCLSALVVIMFAAASCAPKATPTAAPTMAATEAPTAAMTEAPMTTPAGEIDCMGAEVGDTISMLYQWSGVEEENLTKILAPLVEACGIVINPESTRDQALLDTRVQAGTPPDITFWNVTQLSQYETKLVAMTDLGVNGDNYAEYWKSIGTVNGKWLGLPVKADPKTLIWYSPATFSADGYTVPTTWDDLDTLVEKMVADGKVPWSTGMESGDATGWTGTDFIQDILLVTQGPDYVMGIINGTIPYNDPGVKEAYEIYGKWAMSETYAVGGSAGTVSVNFNDAINKVFSTPPEAMMVKQSGFAGGTVKDTYPDLVYGTDFDFFGVPGAKGLQGGSDWMMAFSDSPAVKALVAYLSSAKGGEMWAQVGFDLTPNMAGTVAYTDAALLKKGAILANSTGFTPDIGDSIPGGFGSAEFKGITDYVTGGNLDTILNTIAAAQAEGLN